VRFDVSVHNVIVVAVAQRFCDLPHVVAAKKRDGVESRVPPVSVSPYLTHLATASLYTKPAMARRTISKHRSEPSMLQCRSVLKFRTRAACLIG
jgi:hypothetical protein